MQNEKDGLKEENIKKIVVSQGFNKIEKIKLRESNNWLSDIVSELPVVFEMLNELFIWSKEGD